MKWREIEDLYLAGVGTGGSPDLRAARKRFTFLTEAQRRMAAVLDIPECFRRTVVKTTVNQDWVPTPKELYSIEWIENREGGHKLRQEPEGSTGRSRFFEDDRDRPPASSMESVNFYWREGTKIWLRDTPNESGHLEIEYRFHMPQVTEDDLDYEPILPAQYHLQLANLAVGLYYELHPPMDPTTMAPLLSYGPQRVQTVLASLEAGVPANPRHEENTDRQKTLRQPGYTMGGCR